uniref:Late embryogenesis abundant protein LEA-2 subgroup domain-containing protein n=1 Tax=Picea sitchensis TaxID=3332 RepID=A9NQ42_PICSI|nr:unknown [Picea sitchensis]
MSGKGCVTRNDCGRHGSYCEEWRFRRFLQVLLAFLLIVLFVILVIFLALHPHKPRFYLQNATVRELNVSDGLLTSSLQFTVLSHNPNDRIGVLYDSLSIYASYLGQQITDEYRLPHFYQDDNDFNVLNPVLCGNSVPLAAVVCEHLNSERQNGLLSLSLRMDGRIRWKVGTWTSGHYHLNVNCWTISGMGNNDFGGQVPIQQDTRCHVEV